MKRILILGVAALTLGGTACQSTAPTGNSPANANNANIVVTSGTPTAAAFDLSTPTKTAIIFYQGVKNKDTAKVKATLSAATLDEAQKQASDSGKTIMETISLSAPPPASLDVRNEKINGDTATLEVVGLDPKAPTKAETFYFVKEGAEWKVDLFHDAKNDKKPADDKKPAATPKK